MRWADGHCQRRVWCVGQVGDQQTVLMAYFGVCVKRVLDNVCMVIENKLLQAIPDTVMTELVNTLQCRTEVTLPAHFHITLPCPRIQCIRSLQHGSLSLSDALPCSDLRRRRCWSCSWRTSTPCTAAGVCRPRSAA